MISTQMNNVANENVDMISKSDFLGKEELQIRDKTSDDNYQGVDKRQRR